MQENNSIIIAMLEELLTISKSQRTEQTVNANVDLTPIKDLIENGNRENKEYYDAKTNKLAGFVVNEFSKINKRMDGISEQEQPDFEGVKQQLAEAIDKMDEVKVKHNIDEKRHSFALYTKESWILLSIIIFLMAAGVSAVYHLSRPNIQRDDDALKYRYIKMKGDASAEQIATLEDIFELNRNTEAIEQMREDVENYEEAVRKQAPSLSKRGSKSKRQRNKRAKPSQSRISNSQRITQTRNQNREPMASIKVKFRPSTNENKEGTIYYQIIQNRVIRQLKTDYRLFMHEWNEVESSIIITNSSRQNYLTSIEERVDWDIKRLQSIINQLENKRVKYTADDIIATFQKQSNEQSLFNFMQGVIAKLQQMGKQRTSETYRCTLKSFMQFREDKDVLLEDIDSDLMMMYEAYLRGRGLTKNSTSFYMRILRAVYNRAVEKDLTTNRSPFKHVYTGIDKTVKRAIPLKAIKQIKNLDLSLLPSLDFARDMFLFSFYTRGMSFIDMAYLKKKDLSNGILSYRRRKTMQQLFIRWEKCMQEIVDKYDTDYYSPYLLPILKYPYDRSQYKNMLYRTNKSLKEIAKMVGLSIPLTLYVARHSWASIAKSKNIPISVISEGMGHDSEMTTQIYLASLDNAVVDRANAQILKEL